MNEAIELRKFARRSMIIAMIVGIIIVILDNYFYLFFYP